MRLGFTPDSERELEAIIEFLFEASPQAAARFGDVFDQTTARLLQFPFSGPSLDGDLRMTVVGSTSYVIGYQVVGDVVLITSVRHGAARR